MMGIDLNKKKHGHNNSKKKPLCSMQWCVLFQHADQFGFTMSYHAAMGDKNKRQHVKSAMQNNAE